MKSRFTIEVDFNEGNEPFIEVLVYKTDDMRDKFVQRFFDKLAYQSTWAKIIPGPMLTPDSGIYRIYPISPDQFSDELKILAEQERLYVQTK